MMSHIVLIETEVRDFDAVKLACDRLRLDAPVRGSLELFASTETGYGVQLRDWRYPVVCMLETGELQYDNYGGRWANRIGSLSFCRLTESRRQNWRPESEATT